MSVTMLNILFKKNKLQAGWSKLSLLVALMALCFVAIDISERYTSESRDVSSRIALEPLTSVKSVQLSKSQLEQIKQQYAQFQQDDEEQSSASSEIQGLTAEQQALQQGNLTQVFSGDNMLELKAVISDLETKGDENYALIKVTDIKSGQQTIQAVPDQRSLFGFTLSVINHTSVKLVKERQSNSAQQGIDGQQDIYLMMYQRRISADSNKSPGIQVNR